MSKIIENDVTIVGSGVAGISAANTLINNGYSVTLIEQRDSPGGRINSFLDKKSGDIIENGQHLLMGAYTEFLALIYELGKSKYLKYYDNLDIQIKSKNELYHLSSNSTGKLSFALAILKLNGLQFLDKLYIFYIFHKLQFINSERYLDYNCYDFLKYYKQTDKVISIFWEPLILATLNNIPKNASAALLIIIMKKAFLSTNSNSKMILPIIGLSELIYPIIDKVNLNGIYLPKTKLNNICVTDNVINYLSISSGDKVKSKYYILAMQAYDIIKYYPLSNSDLVNKISKFKYSPIISIYLWFDTGSFNFDYCSLIESDIQWIFNRSNYAMNVGNTFKNHFTALISSADCYIDKSNLEILEIVLDDLYHHFPQLKESKLEHYRIIKEKFATLKITPEIEKNRPNNISEIHNMYVAGDWTNTSLPATIESAAISGKMAAELCIEKLKKGL